MGKRKRSKIVKPWCWYCERDFEDANTLIYHQKAKHFRCPQSDCRRTCVSFSHLLEHAKASHSMELESIPNALPHRNDITMDIVGLDGIPDTDYYEHEKQILGNTGAPTKPKGPSYGELSEDQLRSQVAQYHASIHAAPLMEYQQQHYHNNYNQEAHGHTHQIAHTNDWSNYEHPPLPIGRTALSRHPPPRPRPNYRHSPLPNSGTTVNRHPPRRPRSPKLSVHPTNIPPSLNSSLSALSDPPPPPPPPISRNSSSPSSTVSPPPPPPPPPPLNSMSPSLTVPLPPPPLNSSKPSVSYPDLSPPPPPPPPLESFADISSEPTRRPEFSPPPSVTTTPRSINTTPPAHSLPTPSSINGISFAHQYPRNYVTSSAGAITSNVGSAAWPVSPSSTRDRLINRKPTRIILVYPYEDLSPDELRAISLPKS